AGQGSATSSFAPARSSKEPPMRWLFTAARRLRERGVLGMNERNAACILDCNPRARYPLVDDKLRMQALCRDIGVPTPELYATVGSHSALRRLPELLGGRGGFVIQPNPGSAGARAPGVPAPPPAPRVPPYRDT